MIIRLLFLLVPFFVEVELYGQNSRIPQGKILYNIEDSMPVCKLVSSPEGELDVYYYFGSLYKKVSTDVTFDGGQEALSAYLDYKYHNSIPFDGGYNMGSCIYTILFDSNLGIKEIKIIYKSVLGAKDNFDEIIKNIILSTKGKWKISNEALQEKWYFTIGRFIVKS